MDAERMDALTLSAWLRNAAAAIRPASIPFLLAIVDDALTSTDGIARVSMATLAAETRSSQNTAQRAVADLCATGTIARAEYSAGKVPGYTPRFDFGDPAPVAGPRRKVM